MRACFMLLVLSVAACSRPAPPAPAPAPTEAAAPSAPPLAPSPRLDVRVLDAGFGGVGPASPPGVPNAWAAALVEVSSASADLAEVRAAAITLLDAKGAVIARAKMPIDVRVAPPGRGRGDFSEDGTTPFTGGVAKGRSLILRLHAPLDTRLEELWRAPPETRVRIEITGANGVRAVVEGPAQQWPTG